MLIRPPDAGARASQRKALLIWNPAAGAGRWRARRAGRASGDPIFRLRRALQAGGWDVAIVETLADSGAREVAAAAVEGDFSLLVACGGDGTLQEIAEAVVPRFPPGTPAPTLAAVPWGTANIFARASGCPRSPEAAARWLLRAHPTARALGRVRDPGGRPRYFLSVASVGLDAAVAHELSRGAKRRWGKLAYIGAAFARSHTYFPAPFEIYPGHRAPVHADGLIVALSPFYGGRLRLTRRWPPSDRGAAYLALALREQPRLLLGQSLHLALSSLDEARGVQRLPAGPVHVLTSGRPLELDGEAAGHTPVSIDVIPAGVHVLSAQGGPDPIW